MSHICANCGISIRWQPTIVNKNKYCCAGCSKGGPCTCDYDALPVGQSPITQPVSQRKSLLKRKE